MTDEYAFYPKDFGVLFKEGKSILYSGYHGHNGS